MKPPYNKHAVIDYENAEKNALFRKTLFDINAEYEFIEKYNNPFVSDNERLYLPSFARYSLYFKKIDNNKCKELITGLIFVRQDVKYSNIFYNEESGLYFDLDYYFEKAVGQEKVVKTLEYKLFVCNYFSHFINIKNEDDRIRNKAISLMLKNNMNISVKGEK